MALIRALAPQFIFPLFERQTLSFNRKISQFPKPQLMFKKTLDLYIGFFFQYFFKQALLIYLTGLGVPSPLIGGGERLIFWHTFPYWFHPLEVFPPPKRWSLLVSILWEPQSPISSTFFTGILGPLGFHFFAGVSLPRGHLANLALLWLGAPLSPFGFFHGWFSQDFFPPSSLFFL